MDVNEETERSTSVAAPKKRWNEETLGFCSMLCSALCYTISLSMLRALSNYSTLSTNWSLAVKETTTIVCVTPIILVMFLRGKYRFPSWRVVLSLFVAGVVCQLIGAIPHLQAYALLGLALTTALLQAIQLIFSSIVGAVWLKERVSQSKVVSVILMILAVWLLSCFSGSGDENVPASGAKIGLGLLFVVSTAIGYCGELSIMRNVLRSQTPDEAQNVARVRTPTTLTMVMITGVGAFFCGGFLTATQGVGAWVPPAQECWLYALAAGVANMVGFFFQIEGLRRVYLLKSTLLATAQTATLCLIGVVAFGEPFSWAIGLGLALVVAGVALAGASK